MNRKVKGNYVVLVSDDGNNAVPYKARAVNGYNEGLVITYRNGRDEDDVVGVPKGYRFMELNGDKWVGKRIGNNSACPLMAVDGRQVPEASLIMGVPVDRDCPGDDLSELFRSHFLMMCVRTLYSKTQIPWKIILIIGGVVVAGVLIYKLFGS